MMVEYYKVRVWNIIHPVFYLKHSVSDIVLCLRIQAVPTHLGPTRTSFVDLAQLSKYHLKTDRIQSPKRCVINEKQNDE
jgi:hypothetical protein